MTTIDYPEYKKIYEACFRGLREALGLSPLNDCDSQAQMRKRTHTVYVYRKEGVLVGSVALTGHEIDDLFVANDYQQQGYGSAFLRFAIHKMQLASISPIVLQTADWNGNALKFISQKWL